MTEIVKILSADVLLNAVEDGIWDWNIRTNDATFSPRYYAILGYDNEEWVASYDSWRKLVHPDDLVATEIVLQNSIRTGERFTIEYRMKRKTGEWLWVISRCAYIERDALGVPLRMVGTLIDNNARKALMGKNATLQGIDASSISSKLLFMRSSFILAWATICLALACVIVCIWWLVYPYQGLIQQDNGFNVIPTIVQHGELVNYRSVFCADESLPLPVTVARELELQGPDTMVFGIPPPMSYVMTERCVDRKIVIGIPMYIPPGVYHIHLNTAVQVNPIRVIHQTFTTGAFTIVK